MYFAVPILIAALLGCASAASTWVSSDRRQLLPADPASAIRDEIARLEAELRVEYSQLASLEENNLASTRALRSTTTNTQPSASVSSPSTRSISTSSSSSSPLVTLSSPVRSKTSTQQSTSSSSRSTTTSLLTRTSSISTARSSSPPAASSPTIKASLPGGTTSSIASSVTSSIATSTTSSGSMGSTISSVSAPSATSALSVTSTLSVTSALSVTSTLSVTSALSVTSTLSVTSAPIATSVSITNAPISTSVPIINAPITTSVPISMATVSCESLCSSLTFPVGFDASPVSCVSYAANSTITITGGQRDTTCGSTVVPEIDICRVVLTVVTSDESETYMEVWLPEGNSEWNGRSMSTDNGGVNGCVHFVDMNYVSGLGFAAIGDNAGHNGSSFDGSWFARSNELIIDWAYRARHSSVVVGKAVINQFYNTAPAYSYYIGCSAGGAQGLKSAQAFPNDFDGIISGSAAADFNHLQAWSGRFIQLTGSPSADTFLTSDNWITVQSGIFDQCDAAIDGVDDGILEDPTICPFDSSVLACSNNATLSGCLTDTQITTVNNVFTELYNTDGELLYPALLYGSQVDAFRLGQLSGSVQAISEDWYKFAVNNDPDWVAADMDQADYALADELDAFHGNVSSFSGDLSGFRSAGGKMIMYHGMADPLVSEGSSQRYYLKVGKQMGLDNTGLDNFLRFFRISGMAHCGVGGISGAGAWMFGQNGAASVAPNSIISDLQDWVEDSVAPETLTGTKFWYDTPSFGVQFTRSHCRFPYRTTYRGNDLDSTVASSWTCELIEDWQECGPGATPRLCNVDGSFK